MASPEQQHYSHVEQDQRAQQHGDELPTYDDLAAQNGPNSRFGRWRGWIEKRAAERYIDVSHEERSRRRERGWGNELEITEDPFAEPFNGGPTILRQPPTPGLSIQTNGLSELSLQQAGPPPRPPSPPLPPLPWVSERLAPTHLKVNQFGSRFLPHTTSPIRCLLPLISDSLLLIGHDEGLSVLDMFPQEWNETGGIAIKGPDEAQARSIWKGEIVYQMSILEVENTGEGTPQGVVLMLVGPEPDSPSSKDQDSQKSLRMYNLASLTSLAKWAAAQKGARPLDLHRPSNWNAQQTPTKRQRPQSSLIARGLKSLIDSPPHSEPQTSSYQSLLSPSASTGPSLARGPNRSSSPSRLSPNRRDTEDSWDMIEDLPLRWATDFVPLASSGSRLNNSAILSYAIWSEEGRKGRGGQLLAVATKTAILLYETPKGERAFRFVKEFYTPMQPRSIAFIQQCVQEVSRSPSDVGPGGRFNTSHRRSDSTSTLRLANSPSSSNNVLSYGTQLSIFVIFDKKAGWIRVADSAVGELDLYEDGGAHAQTQQQQGSSRDTLSTAMSSTSIRRSRMSLESSSNTGKWVPPVRCELPLPDNPGATRRVHLLTRGKVTHIVPCPLPANASLYPPLKIVAWQTAPTHVSARVCLPSPEDHDLPPPFVQLIAMGENGVEVQEMSVSFLSKGKGKARLADAIRAETDVGGHTGFLANGGHWDHSNQAFHRVGGLSGLNRSYSTSSDMSANSFDSMGSEDMLVRMARQQGIYGWCRKGMQDWRVFWVGGPLTDDEDPDGGD